MPNAAQQKDFLDAMLTAIKGAIGTHSTATHKIADSHIVLAKHALQRAVVEDGSVVIAPLQETIFSPTNASYDIGYGCTIAIKQNGDQEIDANMDKILYWRQVLIDLFHERRLTGFSAAHLLKVEPRAVFDPGAWSANQDASLIVVRALVRRKNR